MRETSFIQQNEKKWREFEQLLDGQHHDPEKLNDLFIQVTDDLSYARTFYPNRSVRVYLNGLAQKVFFNIYKTKKSRRSRFAAFWLDELPRLIHDARREMLLSFLVFVLAMAIGMLSSWAEPDFLRVILGDSYVDMTEANIKSGDPMAVYKEHGEFNMFLGLTLHNIMVAFQTFIMGIFFAIGTLGSLLYNGIMLGSFQYFFIEKGLFWESFLAVWLHGAFEISSIVIAGAAGLTMGRGLVFPGTLSRGRSFQLAARRGMSLMIGVIPLFIAAGFTESYLTRHTDAPNWLRGLFIFLCFAIVVFYFVIFPKVKARQDQLAGEDLRLAPDVDPRVDFTSVKSAGELFTDTFIFFRKCLRPVVLAALGGTALFCAGAFLLADVPPAELFHYEQGLFGTVKTIPDYFKNDGHTWLFPLTVLAVTLVAFIAQRMIERWRRPVFDEINPEMEIEKTGARTLAVSFLKTMVAVTLFNLLFLLPGWAVFLLIWLAFPVLFLWAQVMHTERLGIFFGLGRSFSLMSGQFGSMVGLFFTLMLCGTLFFLILDTGLIWYLLDVISMNFFLSEAGSQVFQTVAVTAVAVFVLLLVFGLWVAGSGLQYFSSLEANEATFLKKRLELIGKRERIRGLEREG